MTDDAGRTNPGTGASPGGGTTITTGGTTPPAGDKGTPSPPAGGTTDWRAGLPDDLKADGTLGKYKTAEEAHRALVEANKLIGGGVTKIPGLDAKPEEIAAFHRKLGVPEKPEGYELKAPDGSTMDVPVLAHWRGVFHAHGIPPATAQALLNAYGGWQEQVTRQAHAGYLDGLDTLRKEWGEPRFAKLATLAARAVNRFGGKDVQGLLESTKLGDHPALFRMFAAVGEQLAEDGVIEGKVDGVPDAAAIDAKIAALRQDPRFKDANHPQHMQALDEYVNLFRLKLGNDNKKLLTVG